MKKKVVIRIFLIVFTALAMTTSFSRFATASSDDFSTILSQMKAAYELFENGEGEILTTAYFGYINQGDDLIANDDGEISDETINEFYIYKNYYFIEKTVDRIEKTIDSSTWRVSFENKTFFFYPEQWFLVESVYNNAIETTKNSTAGADYDKIFDDYYKAIDSITDRSEIDEIKTALVRESVKRVDFRIVSNVNAKLSAANLPLIDENLYVEYRWNGDNDIYLDWFSETVLKGYANANLVSITVLHGSILDEINDLAVVATSSEYDAIVDAALPEIDSIEVNNVVKNDYLLTSAKEAAFLTLDSFLESESYLSANKKAKKQFDDILGQAKSDIENAETIEEVQRISTAAQEKLADVDTKGNGWIAGLSIGIILFVAAVILAILFAKYRSNENRKQEEKKKRSQRRVYAEKIITSVLNAKENNGNDNE